MFHATDLMWTKNVTRDHGGAWAYLEYGIGDLFYLNFTSHFRNNAMKAQVGEVIMLFQTIKRLGDMKAGTYMTHLVTPIDQVPYRDPQSSHPYTRLVAVIGKPSLPLPKPTHLNFHKPNRGALCELDLIEPFKGSMNILSKQNYFWTLFSAKSPELGDILPGIVNSNTDDLEDQAFTEGRLKYVLKMHKYYERNGALVKLAKEAAVAEERFFCEVCTFDFEDRYPDLGTGFIECHHKTPIARGGVRSNTINDLALVCANCHRMLHRTYDGHFLSVDELRKLVSSVKAH